MRIDGPATPAPGGFKQAVRNPVYGPGGVIVGSGSRPGRNDLPVNQSWSGNARAILQAILMNRANPNENMSLDEEELRRMAMSRLRG
jgi:hypothetical protein